MAKDQDNQDDSARFNLNEIAGSDHAESLLLDKYLVDRKVASARVFRVYRETHRTIMRSRMNTCT